MKRLREKKKREERDTLEFRCLRKLPLKRLESGNDAQNNR